jgi:tRNA A37 threonylcarbamoyladenosine biosynthesis protein TsaE
VVVEWGEKANGFLPGGYYQVNFAAAGETERQIDISFVEAARG